MTDETSSNEPEADKNPAMAIALRLIMGIVGGVIVYVTHPAGPLSSGWWENTAYVPFWLGVALICVALFAPRRWVENSVDAICLLP